MYPSLENSATAIAIRKMLSRNQWEGLCFQCWVYCFSASGLSSQPLIQAHLCLFNFPFIYQFYSIMATLVNSTCWNTADLLIFKSLHQHFKKSVLVMCVTRKRNAAFASISFAVQWNVFSNIWVVIWVTFLAK